MDKRKRIGCTAMQLRRFFDELPEATFCFDMGHARQVDPTMHETLEDEVGLEARGGFGAFLPCFVCGLAFKYARLRIASEAARGRT